jgi:undecaprenyl diphosphate synthase
MDSNTEQNTITRTPFSQLRHIGIIMDGNGRWAKQQGLVRTQGHLEGLKAAKRIVKAASDLGVSFLSLYTFSTENWKRTADEVGFILGLVKQYLKAEFDFYRENRIRIRYTGNIEGLPKDIAREISDVCEETAVFNGMQVVLAINYGGRDEIIRAVRRTGGQYISEENIRKNLDNPDIPDPDLIIRTAGEKRTSNFLLWEAAYSEYHFSDKLWPDWTEADLIMAVEDFKKRERRYGGF